ncbi:hypothetical protein [Nocardia asteroides]|uniref:Uncharacterized protein n=1 Tax=Nocardia asteroides NBRC 15531 TaxID=1110697 RepID=U5EFS5_NOCAS|nr:hypothetical protein [Nocardia asteroides]TLF66879.1 hypothetical protein FEK33_12695 [Nocardia asteroides NBRC 15531]UGT51874.1 hypothetical protein LT345_15505 [Nocardia asteroides]SFN03461.1 hypothetical protein SAMN05444423_105444 [Nocardia asteroides]VEG35215.1 Uncharacterised protein [Nocardia asteroides]GAD85236.1 hypothetical protein NCAST_30_00060 [Nocardia asteroides NBRC 15531]
MMALVWVIDIVVTIVKILGGRTQVNPVLRVGMWITLLCVLLAGLAAGVGLVLLLERWLSTL